MVATWPPRCPADDGRLRRAPGARGDPRTALRSPWPRWALCEVFLPVGGEAPSLATCASGFVWMPSSWRALGPSRPGAGPASIDSWATCSPPRSTLSGPGRSVRSGPPRLARAASVLTAGNSMRHRGVEQPLAHPGAGCDTLHPGDLQAARSDGRVRIVNPCAQGGLRPTSSSVATYNTRIAEPTRPLEREPTRSFRAAPRFRNQVHPSRVEPATWFRIRPISRNQVDPSTSSPRAGSAAPPRRAGAATLASRPRSPTPYFFFFAFFAKIPSISSMIRSMRVAIAS